MFGAKADAIIHSNTGVGFYRGAAIVVRDGQPIRKSYGLANAEWDIPNTPDAPHFSPN